MDQTTTTTIKLTPEDAILFVSFQKRYAFIKVLESVGAFDMRAGSITIHFDNIGQIGSIDKQQHYRI